MPRLEREILNFMSVGNRFRLSKLKSYFSERFDADVSEVEESLEELEKNGDIFRPRDDLVARVSA